MPVQIQCTAIVIRNDALDRCLDGGAANFESIAPNAMSYSDDRLSQASFMSPIDAEEFAKGLELRGLNRDTTDPDFVVVQCHNRSVYPTCDWLILFEYESRLIATIVGSDSRTVIAPASDKPTAVQHYSAEEIEANFEFVRREDSIDVYREKATGKLVYHARRTETSKEVFRQAFDTIWKHRREPGMPPLQDDDRAVITREIEKLQALSAKHPDSGNVALGLGMAWFAVGKNKRAATSLRRAFELDPTNTVILKEWAGVCLVDEDFATALELATKAVALEPDDIQLLGNLAVIQLLSDQVSNALQTIERALQLDASDKVNQNVRTIINNVTSGRRERPKSLNEMMTPAKPKSWLAKLLGSRRMLT